MISTLLATCAVAAPDPYGRALLPDSPYVGQPGWRVEDRMRRHHAPGLSVAVVKGFRIVSARGYGQSDPVARTRVTRETVFDAGSVSKVVAAVAALKLVEQGKLNLDRPVNDYLVRWKLPENEFTRASPVTIRKLLSHTAGTTVSGLWGYLPTEPVPTLEQILQGEAPANNRAVIVNFVPGTERRYSGGGYAIAQMAMEDATGTPFAEIVRREVFEPLGMRRSTFDALRLPIAGDIARGTSRMTYFNDEPAYHPHAAAAGLLTTPTDLALLMIDLQLSLRDGSGRVLRKSSVEEMVSPVVRDYSPWDRNASNRTFYQWDQGLGAYLKSRSGAARERRYLEHGGANYGFLSEFVMGLSGGDGVVAMTNQGDSDELLQEFVRGVAREDRWPDYLPTAIVKKDMPAAELDRYVGRFRRSPENVVEIYRVGGSLMYRDRWTAPHELVPVGEDRFEHASYFGRESRFQMEQRRPVAIERDGQRMPAMNGEPLAAVELLQRGQIRAGIDAFRAAKPSARTLLDVADNLLMLWDQPEAATAVLDLAVELHPSDEMAPVTQRNVRAHLVRRSVRRELVQSGGTSVTSLLDRYRDVPLERAIRGAAAELLANKRGESAVTMLQVAVARDPGSGILSDALAGALLHSGHRAEAMREYRRCLGLIPASSPRAEAIRKLLRP